MKHDYTAIAASAIAALLLAVSPAAAGDESKTDAPSASPRTDAIKDDMPKPDRNNAEKAVDADKKPGLDQANSPSASPNTGDVKTDISKDKDNAEKPVK